MGGSKVTLIRSAVTAAAGGCALFLLLALAAGRAYVRSPHPSDQILIDNLRLHGVRYRALVAEKAERLGLSEAEGVLVEESDREWGPPGEVTRTTKGYVYSTEELRPLVDSLDGFKAGDEAFAYRKIEGNWYLYCYASVDKPE